MLFKEIITAYSENRMKHMNTLFGQYARFPNINLRLILGITNLRFYLSRTSLSFSLLILSLINLAVIIRDFDYI
jgi:hypothetical protein